MADTWVPEFGDRVIVNTGDVLTKQGITHKGISQQIVSRRPRGFTPAPGHALSGWVRLREQCRHWWDPKKHGKDREGILIGWRTVSDGWRDHIGYEEGYAWVPVVHYRVALVVFSDHENPVRVFPSDLRPF